MASVLEKAFNATVRGVATNDEAIQELETQRFELIVTDLSHPGGNGLELLAGLHSEMPLTEKAARAALAKDVIAMANTGGGTIVVGVDESTPGSFVPSGMPESSCAPLETTRLNQALSAFVDPQLGIRSRQVLYNGKRFVFIEVPSAAPQLAMPRRDHPEAGLLVGRIYVRTTAAQSAPLQTSEEIRTLVERLARELVRAWKEETPEA